MGTDQAELRLLPMVEARSFLNFLLGTRPPVLSSGSFFSTVVNGAFVLIAVSFQKFCLTLVFKV